MRLPSRVRIEGIYNLVKLIWLQLREITRNGKMPPREWIAAKERYVVVFGDRFAANR